MAYSSPHPVTVGRRRRQPLSLRPPRLHRRDGIFVILCLAFGLALYHRMALAAVSGELLERYGLSASQLGALGAYYFYPYALLQIPIGFVVDRFGPRRVIITSLSVATVGALVFALASTYAWLAIGRGLVGFGLAGIFIPALKLLSAWYSARDLALWSGLFFGVSGIGVLAAGRPLVELTGRLGWSGAFLLSAGITAIVAFSAWVVIRDAPGKPAEQAGISSQTARPVSWADLSYVLRSANLYWFGLGGFLIYGVHASFQAIWAGPFLRDVAHFSPAQIGNLLMLIQIGGSVGNVVFGWGADRLLRSRTWGAIIGCSIYSALWLPLAVLTSLPSSFVLASLYLGLGFTFSAYLLVFSVVRGNFPVAVASMAVGVVNLVGMLGGAVTQHAFGLLLDRFSGWTGVYSPADYRAVFAVGMVMAAAGALALFTGMLRSKG